MRYEDAEVTVLDLLKDRPRHTEWHRHLVDLALYRGDFDGAVPRLKALIAREKQESLAGVLTEELIQVLVKADQAAEAVEIAKRWHEDATEENYRRDLYLRVLSAADRDDESVNTARRWLDVMNSRFLWPGRLTFLRACFGIVLSILYRNFDGTLDRPVAFAQQRVGPLSLLDQLRALSAGIHELHLSPGHRGSFRT